MCEIKLQYQTKFVFKIKVNIKPTSNFQRVNLINANLTFVLFAFV